MSFVLVLGRQYGSGGRDTGKRIAEALHIPYYDKELLAAAAGRLGFSEDIFKRADERKPSALRSMMGMNYGVMDTYSKSALSNESLYAAQCEVIRAISKEGSCVIVGRTADHILRDHPNLISVFIHAPLDYRIQRVMQRHPEMSISEAKNLINKKDKNREKYYNYFTGRNWGHSANYHLSIDSSTISSESLNNLLENYIKNKTLKDN